LRNEELHYLGRKADAFLKDATNLVSSRRRRLAKPSERALLASVEKTPPSVLNDGNSEGLMC
jgi:hypothetical protein